MQSMPWQKGQPAGLAFSWRLVSVRGGVHPAATHCKLQYIKACNLHAHLFLQLDQRSEPN